MKIDDMIKELQSIKEEHGNLDVYTQEFVERNDCKMYSRTRILHECKFSITNGKDFKPIVIADSWN